MLKLAILASGSGSNAQAILDKIQSGILNARVTLIFSNTPRAHVLERAQAAGVKNICLDHRKAENREAFDRAILELLAECGCDLVVLAGYMRLLGKEFLNRWAGRVINIHPALLPSFPGIHGARDAVEYGVRLAGPTVHFVEEEMDSGPVIIQAATPVLQDDTQESLQQRIHLLEHRIYPQAIQWLATGRIRVEGRKVCLQPAGMPLAEPPHDTLIWPPLEKGF